MDGSSSILTAAGAVPVFHRIPFFAVAPKRHGPNTLGVYVAELLGVKAALGSTLSVAPSSAMYRGNLRCSRHYLRGEGRVGGLIGDAMLGDFEVVETPRGDVGIAGSVLEETEP